MDLFTDITNFTVAYYSRCYFDVFFHFGVCIGQKITSHFLIQIFYTGPRRVTLFHFISVFEKY